MNPYFQNQQFGYPNQGAYYGYNQKAYQNYGYANQPQTIEAMYTTVHPYNNEQFLLNTFGNKPQYISIFLTLSHQDKLKMYMLMEQKKLYGQMSDKQAYQKILKQIAQKIQNFNLFHHAESHNKTAQDKSKELESKIDLIVEKTFEKLNLAQSQTKSNETEKKEQEIDDQEQWVQSTQTNEFQKQNSSMTKPTLIQSQQNHSPTRSKQSLVNNPIFNMFTFDNSMQEAMTHQIGLKTANELQKKSIWDLQVGQSQIMQREPNLKQIFGVKTSQQNVKEPKIIQNCTEKPQHNLKLQSLSKPIQNTYQSSNFHINSTSIYDLYKINSAPMQVVTINNKQQRQKQQDFDNFTESTHHQPNPIQNSLDLKNITIENAQSQENSNYFGNLQKADVIQNNNIQTQQVQQVQQFQQINQLQMAKQDQNQDQEFQFCQQNEQTIPKIQSQENSQTQSKRAYNTDNNTIDYQSMLFDSVQVQTPAVSVQFNFLEAFTSQSVKFQNNYQIPQQSQPNKLQEIEQIGQNLFQSQVFSQHGIPQHQQIIEHISQKNSQTVPIDLIRSSLATHNWQHQEMLKQLKIQLNEVDKSTALKGLKNRSFECNTQFYQIIISYLRQLSLQWSPEYRHMNQQLTIVKQLHQQSQRYTSAVDQDQQQEVTLSIRKTKKLLNNLYQNSPKTEKYVMSLLDDKCEQKGLLYKFGRNLLSSSLSTEIFQKVINQDTKQIFKSFIVLYTIQKLSSIPKLKLFSQKLMNYLAQQYQKYKNLEEQKLSQVQNQEESYPKYILFIKGLVKICGICQRMITLLKYCCIKTSHNTVKLLKICKDIRIKYSQYDDNSKSRVDDLLELQEVIKTDIQRNKSVYDLHTDFFNSYNAKPVCGLCLRQIKNDGNIIQDTYYHFSCFNLSSRLEKQIEQFRQ